jgi:hypothetical protein
MVMPYDLALAKFQAQGQSKWPPGFNFDEAWNEADNLRPEVTGLSPRAVMLDFLDAAHRAPAATYLEKALAKLNSVREAHMECLLGALIWAKQQRELEDERQRAALREAGQFYHAKGDTFLAQFSAHLSTL